MARETWVRSQVESYQRLKKWYLTPPCLTLSIIRFGSRVKWSNPGKGVVPSPTHWCSKLSIREPSGDPRLWSPTLLTYVVIGIYIFRKNGLRLFFFRPGSQCTELSYEIIGRERERERERERTSDYKPISSIDTKGTQTSLSYFMFCKSRLNFWVKLM